jgi:hypothetical protein
VNYKVETLIVKPDEAETREKRIITFGKDARARKAGLRAACKSFGEHSRAMVFPSTNTLSAARALSQKSR